MREIVRCNIDRPMGDSNMISRQDSNTAGTTETLSEQQLDQVSGGLSPIGGLTADGHVSFTPDGQRLVISIKGLNGA